MKRKRTCWDLKNADNMITFEENNSIHSTTLKHEFAKLGKSRELLIRRLKSISADTVDSILHVPADDDELPKENEFGNTKYFCENNNDEKWTFTGKRSTVFIWNLWNYQKPYFTCFSATIIFLQRFFLPRLRGGQTALPFILHEIHLKLLL